MDTYSKYRAKNALARLKCEIFAIFANNLVKKKFPCSLWKKGREIIRARRVWEFVVRLCLPVMSEFISTTSHQQTLPRRELNKDSSRHAKVGGVKAMRPQPHTHRN